MYDDEAYCILDAEWCLDLDTPGPAVLVMNLQETRLEPENEWSVRAYSIMVLGSSDALVCTCTGSTNYFLLIDIMTTI